MTETAPFYRLTNAEWTKASRELTPAEVKVLYHLRTLDPFGDKAYSLRVIDIAQATDLTKGTVSKALCALDKKEWISLEILKAKIQLRTKAKRFLQETEFPPGNQDAHQETSTHARKLGFPQETAENPSQQSLQEFSTEKTPGSDRSDDQTLSDPTDEKFLNWIKTEYSKKFPSVRHVNAWAKKVSGDPKVKAEYERGQTDREFNRWWSLARQLNLVDASAKELDGAIKIYPSTGPPIPWLIIRKILPLDLMEARDLTTLTSRLRQHNLTALADLLQPNKEEF